MDRKQKVVFSERSLREEIGRVFIEPFNQYLVKLHKTTADMITMCLGDQDKGDQEAYACKTKVENEFLRKQEYLTFFGETVNKKMAGCIGNCRDDMTLEVDECYEECLTNFKGYVENLFE